MAAIRARAQLVPPDGLSEEQARGLLKEMDQAQADYERLWREIYNASPTYRALCFDVSSAPATESLRKRWRGTQTVMLQYHLGPARGHVLLLGEGTRGEAFDLRVPAAVADRIDVRGRARPSLSGRSLLIVSEKPTGQPPAPLPAPGKGEKGVPLTAEVAAALIDDYRSLVADPDYRLTHGLELRPREKKRPLPVQRPELPGDAFLPVALRKRLAELKPEAVVVVPDGA
jgi:hypothetical protein